MKRLALPLLILAITGCATGQYDAYAKAQGDIARYKADAEVARFKALALIAGSDSESARIAAVMAIAMGGNAGTAQAQQIAAPQNEALQWASILVPGLTSVAGMYYSNRSAMSAADASARVSESTNTAFTAMAGKIQATPVVVPQANVSTVNTTTSTTNTTTDTTLSGTGVLGSGSYTSTPTSTNTYPITTTTNTYPITTNSYPITTTTTSYPPTVYVVPTATPVTPVTPTAPVVPVTPVTPVCVPGSHTGPTVGPGPGTVC